jgi:hypothetical protein
VTATGAKVKGSRHAPQKAPISSVIRRMLRRLRVPVMRVAARAPTPNVGKSRAEQLGLRVKVVGYVDG